MNEENNPNVPATLVSAAAHADYSRLHFDHMPAATTQSGDTDIAYRIFNRGSENPKLLLIMGLGGAGAAWGDAFLQALEFEGFEVIVIDNRDTGSSAMFTEWGKPTLWWQLLKYELGFSVDSPYDLNDMAADSIAVLDDAGYDQVHVMGVSMGGMIAQVLAAVPRASHQPHFNYVDNLCTSPPTSNISGRRQS